MSKHQNRAAMLENVVDRLPITATVVNDRIMVWGMEDSRLLFDAGFYGKPLGLRKTGKGEVEKPIQLSVFETSYLLERGAIQLMDGEENLSSEAFVERAQTQHEHFKGKQRVYAELRDRGFVVRPGLKFGEAFSVYRQGPGMDHAPYLVHIASFDSRLDPIELVRAGRLSHSVNKLYIIALLKGNDVKFYGFERFKP